MSAWTHNAIGCAHTVDQTAFDYWISLADEGISGSTLVRPHKPYAPRVPLIHDKPAAVARARELRAQGLSLRLIGVRLRKEGLVPLRGGQWHRASVAELLRYHDPATSRGCTAGERATREGTELALRPVSPKWSNQPRRGTKTKKGGKRTDLG